VTVGIVTDSAASLPSTIAEEHGIRVVPMHLLTGGRDVRDGELPLAEVVDEVVRNPKATTTSGPAPGEFLAAIEEVGGPEGTVVLTIAGHMSGTYKAAWAAANLAETPVKVVDTGTAAGAEGLVVLAAAATAATGAPIDVVEARAAMVADRVQLVATVAGLEHLQRSGRVPGIAGWAGRRLGLHPLFSFRGGHVLPLRPAQGRTAALDRMLTRWRRSRPSSPARLHVAVLHALADDEARDLLARVTAEVQPQTAFVGEFSPVMVAHVGPGLIGLAWWWEPGQA
jgi:DegV family protein with EDD domain